MNIFNKPKPLLIALLTCATFSAHAAWWDIWKSAGDDGNANTKGNAAASAAQQQQKIMLVGVINSTDKILGSAVLKNQAGQVVYSSKQGKTCAINAICYLKISRSLVTNGSTLFFYDTNGALASAFIIGNVKPNIQSYNISVDLDSLGVYVFSKIKAVNPKVTYKQIDDNIVTTKLVASPYQELADYYLDLLGNAKDDTKIIKGLANQFAQNIPIPANPKSTRVLAANTMSNTTTKTVKKSVQATNLQSSPMVGAALDQNNPICSENFQSAINIAGKVGEFFKYSGAGIITEAATGITKGLCPNEIDGLKVYMGERFDIIDGKLVSINKSLQALEDKITAFEQAYSTDKLSDQKKDVFDKDDKLQIWNRAYANVLRSGAMQGKKYNTLSELINSYGSVDKAIKQNPEIQNGLNILYKNKDVQDAILFLSRPEAFTLDRLNKLCNDPNTISGDALALRDSCNAVSFDMYVRSALLASQAKYVYDDVYKVYQSDKTSSSRVNSEWHIITPDEFAKLEGSIEKMNPNKAQFALVKPTEPVYTTMESLYKLGFNITGWYPEASKRYIEVQYNVANSPTIKSKYAYQQPNSTKRMEKTPSIEYNGDIDSAIVNVMGVPVPKRFFTGEGQDRNNYGADEKFPWADPTQLAYDASDKMQEGYHWRDYFSPSAYFNVPEHANLGVYAAGFHVPEISGTYLADNGGSTSDEKYANSTYTRRVFARANATKYDVTYHGADWFLIKDGEFFTYMRYTAQDGYSYVWAMRTWLGKEMYGIELFGTPQCMSNDCYIKNTGQKMDLIGFNKGPNIEWTYTNSPGSTDYTIDRTFTLKETK